MNGNQPTRMLETSATRRSTRRATEGHTGTRTSPHSAPPSGYLPEPQIAVRLLTDHTAGPAKPQSIPGSQRTASRPPTQTCPGSTRQPQCSPTNCSNQGATGQQSRRIQVYPDSAQKVTITTWLTASRWTYNLTAEILQSGIPAVWKHIASMVMPEVKALHPEWDSVPYQVKRPAVRDACRAMSNVKTFNLELKFHQAQGNRADEEFAQLGYRSRQNPKQSCYIPDDAVTEHGVYHTILGPLRMAEAIPAEHKECRLVKERGLYWLVVPYPAQCDIETPSGDGVVALDPGVRTFLTYFSETECGKLGHHAFGRIQRLCHWLDDLISRTAKAPNRRKRRQMRSAQARMRQRITNLVDELHWQTGSLVDQQLPDHPATNFRDP